MCMVWLFKVNDSYVWRLNCNARLFELKWSGGMLDSSKTKKTWYYYEPNMTLSISKKNNLHIF